MKKKCLILLIFGLFFITNVKASGYTYRVRILNANPSLTVAFQKKSHK